MDLNLSFGKPVGISQMPKPTGGPRNYLIEAALLLVVSGLFVWFIILPKNAELSARNGDLANLETQRSQIQTQAEQLNKLIEKLKNSQAEIKNLDTALPLAHNAIQFEVLIRNMAESVNVKVGSLNLASKPEAVVAGDKALLTDPFAAKRSLQKLSGSIFVTGNLEQLLDFLKKLEKSGRFIGVTSVQMDSGSEGLLNLRLGIDIYYFGL